MQGIFISYRRQDSQSAAGRLADHVKEQMPGVPLFRDVETIEPGVDFTEAIGRALQSCGALLAVIGPHWTSVTDAAGKRRLDNANDYTRLEIVTALQRSNVRVIPVLVDGAQMPEPNELPEDLQPLCRRNAIELSDKRWSFDVSQLIETLKKTLGVEPVPPHPEPRPQPQPDPVPALQPWYRRVSKKQWWIVGAVVVVLGILGEQGQEGMDTTQLPPPPMTYATTPPVTVLPGSDLGDKDLQALGEKDLQALNRLFRPLTGAWQDAEGGRYRFVEHGGEVKFDGVSPHGPVHGVGEFANNMLILNYTLNGATSFTAQMELSADGGWLRGRYGSAVTGESGMVVLQRTQ
jgi:hypothetical protein